MRFSDLVTDCVYRLCGYHLLIYLFSFDCIILVLETREDGGHYLRGVKKVETVTYEVN